MKVICINDKELPSDKLCPQKVKEKWSPKEGQIYTVEDSFIDGGYCWYVIAEDPYREDEDGCLWGYDSQRFDYISDNQNQAVEEAVNILELTPSKPKKWHEKIFNLTK